MEFEQEPHEPLDLVKAQLPRNRPSHHHRRHSSPPASTGPGHFPMHSARLTEIETESGSLTMTGRLLVKHCLSFLGDQKDSEYRHAVTALAVVAVAAALEVEVEIEKVWSSAELGQELVCLKDY